MQKTILIPTDLTVESLHTLKLALMQNETVQVRILLMYPYRLGDSITDLLFYSPGKIINNEISPEFEEGISILKNRFFHTLHSLSIQLFHGNNTNAFTQYANAYDIHEIYLPQSYLLKNGKKGFDPIPLIDKNKFIVHEVNWESRESAGTNSIAELFNN